MNPERIRELFPGTRDLVYFNAAAQALLPTPVAEAVERVARRHAERGILGYFDDIRERRNGRTGEGERGQTRAHSS